MASLLVQKFGGTSMGSVESIRQVASIIRATRGEKAIVVSAMTGVTNALLELLVAVEKGKRKIIVSGIAALVEKHEAAARELIADSKLLADTERYINKILGDLSIFLQGMLIVGEVGARSRDSVLAAGEQLSSRLLAAHLTATGLEAEQVDFATTVPDTYKVADEAFYIAAEKLFGRKVRTVVQKGKLPIGTGYFGRVPGGMLGAVGRGYSDFCAALVAAGMQAAKLEIWTDVSGVYSADPRKVKSARVLPEVSFEAAAELAHFGAKVLHPQSIHPAVRAKIPVWIKNTFAPKDRGTLVTAKPKKSSFAIDSVTSKKGMTVVSIISLRKMVQKDFLAHVFQLFAQRNIPIDVVSTSEVSVSLVCEDHVAEIRELAAHMSPLAKLSIRTERALVCAVGDAMVHRPGTAGELFSLLGKAGINVEQISQGASERNITFVVEAHLASQAVALIHSHFIA